MSSAGSESVDQVSLAPESIIGKSRTIITAGQHALIRLPSEGLKIVQLKPDGVVSLGKFGSFEVNGVLGYPFGQSFEIIERNTVKPVKSLISGLEVEAEEETSKEQTPDVENLSKADLTSFFSNSAESNEQIIDIGSKIQSLTNVEIDELKKSGASSNIGQQIIEKIIAGHGGFDKKTIFSQQKYLRRKQQKFLRRFTVEYVSSNHLLQYYCEKDLPRILDISEETLGIILNYGNVRPGGTYLLVDDTGGIILYAMMERMNCQGTIILAHENEHPNHIALRYSDYSEELISSVVKPINWLQFLEPENEKIDLEILSQEEIDALKPSKQTQYLRRLKRSQEINNVIERVEKGGLDGFISVSTIHLPTLLPEVLPRIGGSRPIVLYSQYKERLLETQHSLSNDKRVLAPSIFETRVRPYQTIIGRLHPVMTMRGSGGYVLWGTRVFPEENIQAVGRGVNNKRRKEEPKAETTEVQDEVKE